MSLRRHCFIKKQSLYAHSYFLGVRVEGFGVCSNIWCTGEQNNFYTFQTDTWGTWKWQTPKLRAKHVELSVYSRTQSE